MTPALCVNDVGKLIEPWWTRWIAMNWGFRRHTAVYWCATGQVPRDKAFHILGIDAGYPVDVVIFYRELIRNLVPEVELASEIVELTPKPERKQVRRFFAGHLAFESGTGSTKTIARRIDSITEPAGLPRMWRTDDSEDSRIPSYRMIFEALRLTISVRGDDPPFDRPTTPLIFFSSECPELVEVIPSLQMDPKNEEDISRVGTKQDDIWEACKNAFREYPAMIKGEPLAVRRQRAIDSVTEPTHKRLMLLQFDAKNRSGRRIKTR